MLGRSFRSPYAKRCILCHALGAFTLPSSQTHTVSCTRAVTLSSHAHRLSCPARQDNILAMHHAMHWMFTSHAQIKFCMHQMHRFALRCTLASHAPVRNMQPLQLPCSLASCSESFACSPASLLSVSLLSRIPPSCSHAFRSRCSARARPTRSARSRGRP
jgi:hypothetical protein